MKRETSMRGFFFSAFQLVFAVGNGEIIGHVGRFRPCLPCQNGLGPNRNLRRAGGAGPGPVAFKSGWAIAGTPFRTFGAFPVGRAVGVLGIGRNRFSSFDGPPRPGPRPGPGAIAKAGAQEKKGAGWDRKGPHGARKNGRKLRLSKPCRGANPLLFAPSALAKAAQ